MNKHDYHQSKSVPGLWLHEQKPAQFTLVVDDLRVKYVDEEYVLHLKVDLEEDYTLTTEWEDRRHIGIILDVDYKLAQIHLSMSNQVAKAPRQVKHEEQGKQHVPYPSSLIKYRAETIY